jgi:hypothetical protein
MPSYCHHRHPGVFCALAIAFAGGEEMNVGRNGAGQLVAHIGFAQPFPLPVSVFAGINGFATGEEGFHSQPLDEPGEDIFMLNPQADIQATLIFLDPGMHVYISAQPMQLGQIMAFGALPFDYHPLFQIVAGAAVPGQVLHVGLVFHDNSGHHTDSDELLIQFTPEGCPADLASQGGIPGPDGHLDNNDFIVFINDFFAHHAAADLGVQGGAWGHDGLFDNNDFVSFINLFFAGGVCS